MLTDRFFIVFAFLFLLFCCCWLVRCKINRIHVFFISLTTYREISSSEMYNNTCNSINIFMIYLSIFHNTFNPFIFSKLRYRRERERPIHSYLAVGAVSVYYNLFTENFYDRKYFVHAVFFSPLLDTIIDDI